MPTANESKKCPECGCDLTGRDRRAHALSHWPESIPVRPDTLGARQRQAELLQSAPPPSE